MRARGLMCLGVCAVVGLGACGKKDKKSDRPPVTTSATLDGNARLEAAVLPKDYKISLAIDPASTRFEGEVAISVSVEASTRRIIMHAEDLDITRARVLLDGKQVGDIEVQLGEHGGLALNLSEQLSPGDYVISLGYEGDLDEIPTGLYRVKEKESWYAFTQFEPLEARQAFPCFDEPRFKTPYSMTISSPSALVVASNAPEVSAAPDAQRAGWTAHTFAPTKPLPTYLVAFTVGDFDVVEAPEGAIPGVPFRVLAPKGKGYLAKYALETTPKIVAALAEYFGQPYPFAKLDLVAVPNFAAGAMENVGLVTFRETLILLEDNATPSAKYSSLSVNAHEQAHMWFGNLVTPEWWNDLWLNESFATWMAARMVETLAPELEGDIRRQRGVRWTMDSDSLAQTRSIRQPIENGGDVYNAFDGITYSKGAAVLRMTESWLGRDAFRDGVRTFMKDNAYGSVTAPALMTALEGASKKPVSSMMASFIDQPGVPNVEVTLSCTDQGVASVALKQSRYLPKGSKAAQTGPWFIPICIKMMRGTEELVECVELTEPAGKFTLPGAGCPDFIYPNANEDGYYHWSLPASQMTALATTHSAQLTLREQLGLLNHLGALVDAQAILPDAYYSAALSLLAADNDHLLREGVSALSSMRTPARRESLQTEYGALLRKALRPHLDRLGVDVAPGESPTRASLRRSLLGLLGDEGQSVYVMSTAKSVVPAFLADPDDVEPYRAGWAIPLAATQGDAMMWQALVDALPRADKPSSRAVVVQALGNFRDPALLQKSLDLFMDERIRSSEFGSIFYPSFYEAALYEEVTWPWFTRNYEAIVAKLGEKSAPRLPGAGGGFCSAQGREKVQLFFASMGKLPEGSDRNLANTLEGIDRCAIEVAYITPSVVSILKGEKKGASGGVERK